MIWLPLAIAMLSTPDVTEDPAFILARTMVGGKWEGNLGSSVALKFTFTLEDDGKKIVGRGQIFSKGQKPITVLSSLGWDPEKKQMYYLDQHGYNTVYFGHVASEGKNLTFDFNALCGDSGHYKSVEHLGKDEYWSSMSYEKDGKWIDMGFHLSLHRVR